MADGQDAVKAAGWPDSAFWTFSVDLYDRPGVEAACLALQDRRGLNVNLLLFALWLADCGVALDQPTLARANAAVASWQAEIIDPLRGVRLQLRDRIADADSDGIAGQWPRQTKALRQAILAIELDGEHLAQLALGRLGDQLKPSRQASAKLAGDNLASLGMFEEEDRGDLANLIKQVFPDARPAHLEAVLDRVFSET
ncbi:MAG: TIGR02444 family protein [Alphaproteobacteria bacterium]|nr:TIGR02444 family protein [Alphaproteobacteria bacterium]